jgi:hypothetical protein
LARAMRSRPASEERATPAGVALPVPDQVADKRK